MSLPIIAREQWGALPPRIMSNTLQLPVLNVFCMNTHSKPCYDQLVCMGTLRLLQRMHMNKQNQRDIRYNFIIGNDGNIYEGRGWRSPPLLPREHSRLSNSSLLIGYVGDFIAAELPQQMAQLSYDLIDFGLRQGHISEDFLYYDILEKITPSNMNFNFVKREDWSFGKPYLPRYGAIRPASKVFFQNTHSNPCPNDTLCRGYLRYMEFKYATKYTNDIVFNFIIGGDGTVYEARGWEVSPRLPRKHILDCETSILIGFIGYYLKKELPTPMSESSRNLINYGIEHKYISRGFMQQDIMIE